MTTKDTQFITRLAETEADLHAAHRLRYDVFVKELGGDGPLVDHDAQLERDEFDPYYDHLVLIDQTRSATDYDHVVGVYRLLRGEKAAQMGRFYCDGEYDLSALKKSGRSLLELGRSCVHPDYRGGTAMLLLWNALAGYVMDHGVEILFGVASFHGTDLTTLAQPLSYLHENHLAPPELQVRAVDDHHVPMDILPTDQISRMAAMKATPALIKAYLRLGGFVGDGAFVDHEFNTTDVCLIMDTEAMNTKQRNFYLKRNTT